MSDKDIIFPYDISTILNSKQMRIAKTIKTRLSLSAYIKFSQQTLLLRFWEWKFKKLLRKPGEYLKLNIVLVWHAIQGEVAVFPVIIS